MQFYNSANGSLSRSLSSSVLTSVSHPSSWSTPLHPRGFHVGTDVHTPLIVCRNGTNYVYVSDFAEQLDATSSAPRDAPSYPDEVLVFLYVRAHARQQQLLNSTAYNPPAFSSSSQRWWLIHARSLLEGSSGVYRDHLGADL